MESKVLFTKDFSIQGLLKIYKQLGFNPQGRLAIKLHSGEKRNQNYLTPEYFKDLIQPLNGTVVECNTAYPGARNTTEKHLQLLHEHGWDKYFKCEILDAEGPDLELSIPNGNIIKKDIVGKGIEHFDSMLVLSHFKGHPMGGYGGALKQLSIGVASSGGKAYIHSAGVANKQEEVWYHIAEQDAFLYAMADAASAVHNYFKGNICYISVLKNISVDCDCCEVAEDPCMKDIGIMASFDPVALDQACIDIVYAQTDDPGLPHFKERVESRHGLLTIQAAEKLGIGSRKYTLVNIDE